MVKNREFEPRLKKKKMQKGFKATKMLEATISWHQTCAFNMDLITVLDTSLNTLKSFFEYLYL